MTLSTDEFAIPDRIAVDQPGRPADPVHGRWSVSAPLAQGWVCQTGHVCDFTHRWDAGRGVWLCLPNPPWFGRVYTSLGGDTRDRGGQR